MTDVAAPLTDDERAAIIELIRSGLSYVEVARQTARSTGLVAKIAKEIGWSGDQSRLARVQVANENRSAYSAARRAKIAARLAEEAERLLLEMRQPHLAFNFGGKDNTYEEHQLEEPPVDAKRALMQTVRDALRTVIDIDRHDNRAEEGAAAVDAWLRDMIGSGT